eukprot:2843792-Rhodomonas_salina.1
MRNNGIVLPPDGTTQNQASLTVEYTDGQTGRVEPTPVTKSPSVGAFISTSMEFLGDPVQGTKPAAAEPSAIRACFEVNRLLMTGDIMRIALPEFVALYREDVVSLTNTTRNLTVTWDNGLMIVTIGEDAVSDACFTVAYAFGLRLPAEGVRKSNPKIEFSLESGTGIVDPTIVQSVTAIGSFLGDPTLFFSPAQAGVPVNVSISFTPLMTVLAGEILVFDLSSNGNERAFTRQNGRVAPRHIAGPDKNLFDVSWAISRELRLRASSDITPNQRVALTILASAELRTPAFGLTKDNLLLLRTQAIDGIVYGRSIEFNPIGSAGTDDSLAIRFDPPTAGSLAE